MATHQSTVTAALRRDPITVPLGDRSYAIDVCDGRPDLLTDAVARCAPSSILFVTDRNVKRARGAAFERALAPLGVRRTNVTLLPGERRKSLASVSKLWDAALGAGVDRDVLVIAAGGGVVGDLAGFAASTLLRGVRFVQVPTTLLAMVDSSVGGKTGFDHARGKNLIGSFHQPSAVVADLAHLETLPVRELRCGLAEIAKVAVVADAGLLELLERDAAALAAGDRRALAPIVRRAIEAKVRIVAEDEREAGPRALLNLGHTVGHALEVHGAFTRWLHGEAVALGMVAEMEGCAALGLTPPPLVRRVSDLLARLGLPTRLPVAEVSAAWPYVASDKKRDGAALRLPIVRGEGRGVVERVPIEVLRDALGASRGAASP
jgi:shikimate kinase/3-dehydroquinate synthase